MLGVRVVSEMTMPLERRVRRWLAAGVVISGESGREMGIVLGCCDSDGGHWYWYRSRLSMLRVSVLISTFLCRVTLGILSHNGRIFISGRILIGRVLGRRWALRRLCLHIGRVIVSLSVLASVLPESWVYAGSFTDFAATTGGSLIFYGLLLIVSVADFASLAVRSSFSCESLAFESFADAGSFDLSVGGSRLGELTGPGTPGEGVGLGVNFAAWDVGEQ